MDTTSLFSFNQLLEAFSRSYSTLWGGKKIKYIYSNLIKRIKFENFFQLQINPHSNDASAKDMFDKDPGFFVSRITYGMRGTFKDGTQEWADMITIDLSTKRIMDRQVHFERVYKIFSHFSLKV